MSKRALYRGFSTASYLENPSKGFSLKNQDLIKQDLMNHIYTLKGERVHQPNFGTRIPLLAFEPLDEQTVKIITDDLNEVFKYDPRVRLIEMSIQPIPDNNMIVAFVDIEYLELNVTETLKLSFNTGA